MAARIGRTVLQLESELDYSELLEWGEFFDYEFNMRDKQDYYLAQIAQCCVAPWEKEGHKSKVNNFLLIFDDEKSKPVKLSGQEMRAIFEALAGG